MKFRSYILTLLLVALSSNQVFAEEKTAIADNGREVILKDNGEWEYTTDDIFATTPDGQRIRLQPNQRWQEVSDSEAPSFENAPVVVIQQEIQAAPSQTATAPLSIATMVIEDQRETIGKNKRVRSNLVFYLETDGDIQGLAPRDIKVQDSRGRTYPTFSVLPGRAIVGSGERLIVRAKGAPRWWGVKFFQMTIAANAVGNAQSIELRVDMKDVLREEVSELPEDNL